MNFHGGKLSGGIIGARPRPRSRSRSVGKGKGNGKVGKGKGGNETPRDKRCPKGPTRKSGARGALTTPWACRYLDTFRDGKGLGIGKGDEGTARSSCQAPV